MLATRNDDLQGKVCLVSGSGNVAQYTVEKLNELGAKPVTMSDSNGYIYDPDGISPEKLAWVMELKNNRRGRIAEYVKQFPKAQYFEGQRPWSVPCDCAFPSATQNEINGEDARTLIKNGCTLVAEGANMPTDLEGIETYLAAKILYGPAKAANAGPEQPAPLLDAGGSGPQAEEHHGQHPRERPGPRPGILFRQILHQLRHRRQYCRLRESGGFHDRPGSGLTPDCDTLAANVKHNRSAGSFQGASPALEIALNTAPGRTSRNIPQKDFSA